MKILTKKWAEKHEQLRLAHWLKEYEEQKETYEDIKKKSRNDFYDDVAKDKELAKACLKTNITEKLYEAKVEKDRKALLSLPKEIYSKIKDVKSVVLGYGCKEDKDFLMDYADKLRVEVENEAVKANRITEIAEDYLPEEFFLDDVVGELAYEERSNGKDYFINIGGYEICIENFEIIEREDFKINEWEDDNPLTLWTALHAAELHYISEKCFELHFLFVDGDKYGNEKYWYFTLKGTNIRVVE